MAQSYFPSRPLVSEVPIQSKEMVVEEQVNMEDAVDMYLDRRNRCVYRTFDGVEHGLIYRYRFV